MPNPSGSNQFEREPAYGDVKRQTELARSAPMSGAPIATRATEAPRRAKRRATSSGAAPVAEPAAPGLPPVDPQAEVRAIGQALAGHPDSSDTLRQIVQAG